MSTTKLSNFDGWQGHLCNAEAASAIAFYRVRSRWLPQRILQRIAVRQHRFHLRVRRAHQLLHAEKTHRTQHSWKLSSAT